ncbi:MAG: hypothetical protein KH703_08895 [Campylobacter gracilis]|nr:hypothetical protein [Campylobacter gracilis]
MKNAAQRRYSARAAYKAQKYTRRSRREPTTMDVGKAAACGKRIRAMTCMRGEQIPRTACGERQNFIRRSLRQANKFYIRAKPKRGFAEILPV